MDGQEGRRAEVKGHFIFLFFALLFFFLVDLSGVLLFKKLNWRRRIFNKESRLLKSKFTSAIRPVYISHSLYEVFFLNISSHLGMSSRHFLP